MDHATHNKIVSFVWSIADDCLRDVYIRGKYQDATPEEQRVKFVNFADHVRNSRNFQAQYANNPDEQNRHLILEKLIAQAVNQKRKRELDLYKCYASDPDFKRSLEVTIARMIAQGLRNDTQGTVIT